MTRLEELESLPILEMVKQRELDLMSYASSEYEPALRMYGRVRGELESLTAEIRQKSSEGGQYKQAAIDAESRLIDTTEAVLAVIENMSSKKGLGNVWVGRQYSLKQAIDDLNAAVSGTQTASTEREMGRCKECKFPIGDSFEYCLEHQPADSVRPVPKSKSQERRFAHQVPADSRQCRKCGGDMNPGKATGQTWQSGMPDFPGDKRGITLSPGGPGKMIDAMKCVDCGWSVTVESGQSE